MDRNLPTHDLTRTVLAVLFLGSLLTGSFWILRPFLGPLTWAVLLVVATWPALGFLQSVTGGRRSVAVAILMFLVVMVFVLPLTLILSVLVENAPAIAAWVKTLPDRVTETPPGWLVELPFVGPELGATWTEWAAEGPSGLQTRLAPHADELASWFVSQVGGFGLGVVHVGLMLLLSGVLYAKGDSFAGDVRQFARRLAGDRGDRTAVLAASAVRAVALGVVVTALVQSAVGGLGVLVAGIPAAGVLTAVMFVASVAQIGAAPVLALAAVWLFVQGESGWGIGMIVWTVLVGSLDNVIRPLLIKKGIDLPLVLVFSGVVGGLIAFGAVGLFAGPVVLAVGHTLLCAWMAEAGPSAEEHTASMDRV